MPIININNFESKNNHIIVHGGRFKHHSLESESLKNRIPKKYLGKVDDARKRYKVVSFKIFLRFRIKITH